MRVNRLLGAWQAAAREIQKNPNADGARADHLKIGYNDAHKNYQAEMRRFATRMNSYRTQRAAVQIAETPQTLAPFQAAAGALNSRRPMAVLAPPANARGVGEVTALEQAKQVSVSLLTSISPSFVLLVDVHVPRSRGLTSPRPLGFHRPLSLHSSTFIPRRSIRRERCLAILSLCFCRRLES